MVCGSKHGFSVSDLVTRAEPSNQTSATKQACSDVQAIFTPFSYYIFLSSPQENPVGEFQAIFTPFSYSFFFFTGDPVGEWGEYGSDA
jgi:hypothetical protein